MDELIGALEDMPISCKSHNEVIGALDPLPGRISALREPTAAASQHVATPDATRCRNLAFLEYELTTVIAELRPLQGLLNAGDDEELWLRRLSGQAIAVGKFLDSYERHQGRTCSWRVLCKRYKADWDLLDIVWSVVLLCRWPCRYKHLLVAAGDVRHASSLVDADPSSVGLVGMDGPTEKLVRWLMDDTEKLQVKVVSIVGFAGVGKTTLAMEVYNRISGEFECRATAKVSQWPDINKLLEHILSQVDTDGGDRQQYNSTAYLWEEEQLISKIRDHLRDKRYLIIIDDIWDTSDWIKIKHAFPDDEKGGRIMITTCIKTVALSCCSDGLVHEVKPLNELHSKSLFVTKVFGSNHSCPDYLKQDCNEILRRCDGIPLLIIGMANSMKQQMKIQSSTIYKMEQIPELKQVEQTLSLSYDDLPYTLKLLALYMSMFPEEYKIEKNHLIRKWTVEGFLEAVKYTIEDIFSELINRNIIHLLNWKYNSEMEICHFITANTVMNQFLASKAAEKNLLATSKTLKSTASNKIKYLSLHYRDPELPTVLETIDLSHVRSLSISNAVDRIPLDKFIYLTVLDVEGWKNLENDNLGDICKLFLLTYLSLRNTPVSKLPPQIKELCYLQTLDVSQTKISDLPPEVCQLRELNELYLSQTQISNLPLQIKKLHVLETLDIRQTKISQLPEHIYQREMLSQLLVGGDNSNEGIKITERIRHLGWLGTLATVDLSECSESLVEALGQLSFLRKLAIVWSFEQSADTRYQKSLLSSLKNWVRLESLTIYCGFGCSMEFLASLSSPPLNLEKLNVTGRFIRVPQWIKGLEHLAFLQVRVCTLETEDLEILGDLKSLECLVLGLEFLAEKQIVIKKARFRQLRRFSVDCRVPWITFEAGAMRHLIDLELKFSRGPANQRSVPSGIEHLMSIEDVVLRYSPLCADSPSVKATVDAVRKAVGKHYNQIKLVINDKEENVQANHDEVESCQAGPSVPANDKE